MRKLAASLLACVLSALAGGLVAQQRAVWSGAGEEFVLVFFAVGAALMVAGASFFAAQFFGRRAIDGTGIVLTILALAALAALWFFVRYGQAKHEAATEDLSLLADMGLAVLVVIATHWLTIRLMRRQ